jgi:hypothetical protein
MFKIKQFEMCQFFLAHPVLTVTHWLAELHPREKQINTN